MKKELLVFLMLGMFCVSVSASIINVPGDNATIQDAIDSADNGDVINISAGTYIEDLVINKKVSLIGESSGVVTVSGIHVISSSDVIIEEITFETTGTTITLDSSDSVIDDVSISDCVFELQDDPSVGIHVGGGNPVNKVTDLVIDNNIFNGPVNKICNPWKVGGSFGLPLSAEVNDIDFINNEVNRCSIPLNLHNENLRDILINNNIFRDTDGVLYIWGNTSGPTGVLSKFVFTNNDIDGSNSYGIGIGVFNEFTDINFGTGNEINYNSFGGIAGAYGFEAVSILATLTTYELDAQYNWWGAHDGPGPVGPGSGDGVSVDVDYAPWLGVSIGGKAIEPKCVIATENVTLYANVTSDACVGDVIFSLNVGGDNINLTGSVSGSGIATHEVVVSSSLLVPGELDWTVYADDCYNHTKRNGDEYFNVTPRTNLTHVPSSPDGENDWYVSEPTWTLTNPDAGDIWYRWEGESNTVYAGAFGLEDAPNNAQETGLKLGLTYWSDVCGGEEEQEEIFWIDLLDPEIKNIAPENGSKINSAEVIYAYINNEIGTLSSGINQDSINLLVNGVPVDFDINEESGLDLSVSYDPVTLADGIYNVYMNVTDNAGRYSERAWVFEVLENATFDMQISSPEEVLYLSKKVTLNISLDKEAKRIHYTYLSSSGKLKSRKLCSNCDEYGSSKRKTKSFSEGKNNITIEALDEFGNSETQNFVFTVDTKDPRIYRVYPKRGFSDGNFEVQFKEANPVEVILHYNNRSANLSIGDDCVLERGKYICNKWVNLSDYSVGEIEYWFEVIDIAGNKEESKPKSLNVDYAAPSVVDYTDYNVSYKYVYFEFNVTEENFDEAVYTYIDHRGRLKERRLCSRLKDGMCSKKKSFRRGNYTLTLQFIDGAGNIEAFPVDLEIDY